MDSQRIEEIRRSFEEALDDVLATVREVEKTTLEDLDEKRLEEFEDGGLYEFTRYRRLVGGRIIFRCIKADGKTFFNEKYRIYRKEDLYGIELRTNPSYLEAVGSSIYRRIPEGTVTLDLGCGSAKYLLAADSPERTVLAVDISGDLIEDNRKTAGLQNIHFMRGDMLNLNPVATGELDYITGVNILNVLGVDDVALLLSQALRTAREGMLFGFTLPSQADLWADIPADDFKLAMEGLNHPRDADPRERALAAKYSFMGLMNLFSFVKAMAARKGWLLRIFRFLDSHSYDWDDFLDTEDADYIGHGNNALFKFLEYPYRRAARLDSVAEGRALVHAVGYGVEVYFRPERALPPAPEVRYLADDTPLQELTVEKEMNASIDDWKLPFEKIRIESA
ncbi:MAG TPA: class I SAM-dependent methyltransferase [Deltaproteobacteria bacterium]|nr:class I SAM-dependent methyltransferase [Deltaproteobacteria bacterium]